MIEDSPVRTADTDYPELVVEWLPTAGPFESGGDWCDITAYVRAGSCSSGRQYELDRFQAGTCDLTLVAPTRLFDPDWSSGPFYPWLVPMRQLRVSAVWSDTRYPLWRGYITDWGQTVVSADNQFQTTIQAKDALALFEAISLPSSWCELAISADRPSHWWTLSESGGTVAVDSGYAPTAASGSYIGSPTFGSTPLVTYSGGTVAVAFPVGAYVRVLRGAPPSGTFTVELWCSLPDTDTLSGAYHSLFDIDGNIGPTTRPTLEISTSNTSPGTVVAKVYASNGINRSLATVQSTGRIDDATTHHVVATFVGATRLLSLYIDGVLVGSDTAGSGTADFDGNALVRFGSYAPSTFSALAVTMQHVAVYDAALLASQVLAHYNAGTNAFTGDATGTRIGRVLDLKSWPTPLRSIDTGVSTVGAYELAGETVGEYVQKMAETEAGQTYVDPDGKLVHRNRQNLWLEARSQTSQATFGDVHSTSTNKYLADGFELVRDETRIRNPVIASRSGGITVTKTDRTYIEKYGERSWNAPTTYDSTDNVIGDRAAYFLSRYKELGTRVASMRIAPMRDPANLWPQVLGRRIADRITVKRTPLGTGNEISVEQIIEGVAHTFAPRSWITTYRASPAETTVYFILDDATYGELNDDKLAY